ncbi:MAG: hypothetical protein ACRDRO_14585 [Pseudonocardiaceae bacterium]
MTTVEEDRTQAHIHGPLAMLRDAETDFRRSYARVLNVVTELEQERTAAVAGFGTTTGLLAGVSTCPKRRQGLGRAGRVAHTPPITDRSPT